MIETRHKKGSQFGGSLVEALVATAILVTAISFAARGFFGNMQARESFRVSRTAKKVESAIQKQIAFYFQRAFDNSEPNSDPQVPICSDLNGMSVRSASLEDDIDLQVFSENRLPQSNNLPNSWQIGLNRCNNPDPNSEGRHFECAIYRTRNPRTGQMVRRGFIEVDLRKFDFVDFERINNCSAYTRSLPRGFRLAYNIYSFTERKGRLRFFQTGGIKWTSGPFYPPKPPTFQGLVAGNLVSKEEGGNCAKTKETSQLPGDRGPCFNYQEERFVICNAVNASCPVIRELFDDLNAAKDAGQNQRAARIQNRIDRFEDQLGQPLPTRAQCTNWETSCRGNNPRIPTDISREDFPTGFSCGLAGVVVNGQLEQICPSPRVQVPGSL